MDGNLTVSVSPHIRAPRTTRGIMLDVIIALVPVTVASCVLFGMKAAALIAVCVIFSVGGEFLFNLILKRRNTVGDLSAIVTGILLALNLPASAELWQAAFGSLVAIIVVKGLFGGLGQNFANPAATARVVLLLTFSKSMAAPSFPLARFTDIVTGATPLAVLSGEEGELPAIWEMLCGLHAGSIGETCTAALLIGGIYLLARRVITWHTPVSYIGTVFVFSFLFGISRGEPLTYAIYEVLGGGVVICAIFMATDYATTPTTTLGKVIFGFGCGLVTMLIRLFGSYPEGVSFSILFMNILTPYIEKLTQRRPLGAIRQKAASAAKSV